MEWNVYYHNPNKDKIESYNIFQHHSFAKEINNILTTHKPDTHKDYAEEIRQCLFYYFRSKCEWEVEISAWVSGNAKIKIDIYEQIMMNWNRFIEYVLGNKVGVNLVISEDSICKLQEKQLC